MIVLWETGDVAALLLEPPKLMPKRGAERVRGVNIRRRVRRLWRAGGIVGGMVEPARRVEREKTM